jgi:hypothetical protein
MSQLRKPWPSSLAAAGRGGPKAQSAPAGRRRAERGALTL